MLARFKYVPYQQRPEVTRARARAKLAKFEYVPPSQQMGGQDQGQEELHDEEDQTIRVQEDVKKEEVDGSRTSSAISDDNDDNTCRGNSRCISPSSTLSDDNDDNTCREEDDNDDNTCHDEYEDGPNPHKVMSNTHSLTHLQHYVDHQTFRDKNSHNNTVSSGVNKEDRMLLCNTLSNQEKIGREEVVIVEFSDQFKQTSSEREIQDQPGRINYANLGDLGPILED